MKSLYESLLDNKKDREKKIVNHTTPFQFLQYIRDAFGKLEIKTRMLKRYPNHYLGDVDVEKIKSQNQAVDKTTELINKFSKLVKKEGWAYTPDNEPKHFHWPDADEYGWHPKYTTIIDDKKLTYSLNVVLVIRHPFAEDKDQTDKFELNISTNTHPEDSEYDLVTIARETNTLYK